MDDAERRGEGEDSSSGEESSGGQCGPEEEEEEGYYLPVDAGAIDGVGHHGITGITCEEAV
jgi:hypothetical protein